jgi:hypothetical protein
MGHEAIHPASPEPRQSPVLLDRLTGWTGVLEVHLKATREHPLVIGSGLLLLESVPRTRRTDLVADVVRRGPNQVPVLPGSSLKGAVRQVYELLTGSCGLPEGKGCNPRDPVCPACSLFGTLGLAGRVSLGEATPLEGDYEIRRTPTPWLAQKPVEETTRVYDQKKAVSLDGPREEIESTLAIWGTFLFGLRLMNASDDELGLLFASLGIGAPSPMLRLGGKKYHGFGAVDVGITYALQMYPGRKILENPQLQDWVHERTEQAFRQTPERRAVWEALHDRLSLS